MGPPNDANLISDRNGLGAFLEEDISTLADYARVTARHSSAKTLHAMAFQKRVLEVV